VIAPRRITAAKMQGMGGMDGIQRMFVALATLGGLLLVASMVALAILELTN